jgi:hypothetical protein
MNETGFEYSTQPTFVSEGNILTMKFEVYHIGNEEAELTGLVDWQDDITIFQTEHIKIINFINIMKTASMAIEDCKQHLFDPNKSSGDISQVVSSIKNILENNQ